jgi:hypothetical protein
VLAAVVALTAVAVLSGCTAKVADAAAKPASLIGTWFDDASGAQYRFVSDSVLVVPREMPGGGNAVTYSRLGGDRIDVVYAGVHRVSIIDELTPDRLVLADPLSDERQVLMSDAGRTTFASALATAAVDHASAVGSMTVSPDILWVADAPADQDPDWTSWSPASLAAYAAEWDWGSVMRAKGAPIVASGGGPDIAFTFTLKREIPTAADLEAAHERLTAALANMSVEPTGGLPYIDVGYSASKTDYPAGTLVYLPDGLVYSLGDGYAIPVGLDPATESFVPVTHD